VALGVEVALTETQYGPLLTAEGRIGEAPEQWITLRVCGTVGTDISQWARWRSRVDLVHQAGS
jgi:hypothetical protein